MLANLRINGTPEEGAVALAACSSCTAPAVPSDFALTIGTLAGRRMMSVSVPMHTNEMKPINLLSYRLRDIGWSGAPETFCVTVLRPADEAAAA